MQERYCLQMVACGGNTGGNNDGEPVGSVLTYMGTRAPKHYIVCDGTEIDISDYPYLSNQFLQEFGAVNYFGGDGVQTFAVPDLRNEFLRGFHGAAPELSGEVGRHQEATIHTNVCGNGNSTILANDLPYFGDNNSRKPDTCHLSNKVRYVSAANISNDARGFDYTSRPTNVAVLYCIKYEPA